MRYFAAFVLLLLIVPVASAERMDRCRGALARYCEAPALPDVEVPDVPTVPSLTGVPDPEELPTIDPGLPQVFGVPEELPPVPGIGADPCVLFPNTIPTPAAFIAGTLRDLGYSSEELDDDIRALGAPRERCEGYLH